MDLQKTLYPLLGVLVSIIIIATVAMPTITSASTTTTTTTTTEIQDIEVSDPIYYKDAYSTVWVNYSQGGIPSIEQYYNNAFTGYTFSGDFVSIPIIISDTVVSILYKDGNNCYVCSSGYGIDGSFRSDRITLDSSHTIQITVSASNMEVRRMEVGSPAGTGTSFKSPNWHYLVSIPENGGNYVTSTTQETVTLGSLNEIISGSAYYSGSSVLSFAFFHNGEQTHYGDYMLEFNSIQTDAGVDVSLKASYGNTEVLVLVPTTTEVTVTQTITVQTEYGPILNVVLLMLFIVPVTAVAAMLYTRRD